MSAMQRIPEAVVALWYSFSNEQTWVSFACVCRMTRRVSHATHVSIPHAQIQRLVAFDRARFVARCRSLSVNLHHESVELDLMDAIGDDKNRHLQSLELHHDGSCPYCQRESYKQRFRHTALPRLTELPCLNRLLHLTVNSHPGHIDLSRPLRFYVLPRVSDFHGYYQTLARLLERCTSLTHLDVFVERAADICSSDTYAHVDGARRGHYTVQLQATSLPPTLLSLTIRTPVRATTALTFDVSGVGRQCPLLRRLSVLGAMFGSCARPYEAEYKQRTQEEAALFASLTSLAVSALHEHHLRGSPSPALPQLQELELRSLEMTQDFMALSTATRLRSLVVRRDNSGEASRLVRASGLLRASGLHHLSFPTSLTHLAVLSVNGSQAMSTPVFLRYPELFWCVRSVAWDTSSRDESELKPVLALLTGFANLTHLELIGSNPFCSLRSLPLLPCVIDFRYTPHYRASRMQSLVASPLLEWMPALKFLQGSLLDCLDTKAT